MLTIGNVRLCLVQSIDLAEQKKGRNAMHPNRRNSRERIDLCIKNQELGRPANGWSAWPS
jgi:hypothetical protein